MVGKDNEHDSNRVGKDLFFLLASSLFGNVINMWIAVEFLEG